LAGLRLEKLALPGGHEVCYNHDDANDCFKALGRAADIADGDSGGWSASVGSAPGVPQRRAGAAMERMTKDALAEAAARRARRKRR